MTRLLLGHVTGAHGIKGALRVRPASGNAPATADALTKIPALHLDDERFTLVRVRAQPDDLLVELGGLTDRTRAEGLRGRSVYVERGQLPEPSAEELYVADLVGCEVVSPAGTLLGTVASTFHSGAHELLVLESDKMLPFVPPMLVDVDLPNRRIVYDAPPGMLDDDAEVVPQGE